MFQIKTDCIFNMSSIRMFIFCMLCSSILKLKWIIWQICHSRTIAAFCILNWNAPLSKGGHIQFDSNKRSFAVRAELISLQQLGNFLFALHYWQSISVIHIVMIILFLVSKIFNIQTILISLYYILFTLYFIPYWFSYYASFNNYYHHHDFQLPNELLNVLIFCPSLFSHSFVIRLIFAYSRYQDEFWYKMHWLFIYMIKFFWAKYKKWILL